MTRPCLPSPQLALFCFLLSAFCFGASGQTYSITGSRITAGGGTSTAGPYALSGSLGQFDAGGPLTSGPYSVTGGFWALPQAVPASDTAILIMGRMGRMGRMADDPMWPRTP